MKAQCHLTSAAKTARSLRSVSPVFVKTHPRTTPDRLLRARRWEYPEVQVLRLGFRKMTMARSKCSNLRPDTLMRAHLPPAQQNSLATHGRTIHPGQNLTWPERQLLAQTGQAVSVAARIGSCTRRHGYAG